MDKPRVRHTVRLPDRAAHLVDVEMSVDEADEGGTFLDFPVWTPGSYLVREYARHVIGLAATRFGGEPVPVTKVDKCTFQVDAKPGKKVIVRFRVYANELTVRTSHVDSDHAYLVTAATFPCVRGRGKEPVEVTILRPEGWNIATALPLSGEDTFRADDYDHLVDSPIEVGPHRVISFEVSGIPHRIALAGEGNFDLDKLLEDTHAICRTAAEVFGGEVPSRSYTFLWHVLEGAGGGIEHRDSCVCGFAPFSFRPPRSYVRQLSLISHEYFHTWNVKRIRPAELGPFDYRRENYTRLLWVSEGFTSYYDGLILRRAGLSSVPVFLDGLARMIRTYRETPGHAVDSVEQASFDAWIKLYRPHENLRNMTVSYYLKGALVALLLDLTIRDLSDGAKSLDDVMRSLWAGYKARPERGFTEAELMEALLEAAGRSLQPEIDAFVKGTGPLPLEEALSRVGLALVVSDGAEPARPWLGLVPGDGGRVREVLDGSPARAAGLNAGDELIALDGFRLGDLAERLAERQAGDTAVFTVSRRGRIREIPVVLAGDPGFDRVLRPREGAGEREERLFAGWLGEPLSTAGQSAGPPPKEPAPRPI